MNKLVEPERRGSVASQDPAVGMDAKDAQGDASVSSTSDGKMSCCKGCGICCAAFLVILILIFVVYKYWPRCYTTDAEYEHESGDRVIYLMRHAQSERNKIMSDCKHFRPLFWKLMFRYNDQDKKYASISDPLITAKGVAQARKAAEFFQRLQAGELPNLEPFKSITISPLRRVAMTLHHATGPTKDGDDIVNLGCVGSTGTSGASSGKVPITVLPCLQEMNHQTRILWRNIGGFKCKPPTQLAEEYARIAKPSPEHVEGPDEATNSHAWRFHFEPEHFRGEYKGPVWRMTPDRGEVGGIKFPREDSLASKGAHANTSPAYEVITPKYHRGNYVPCLYADPEEHPDRFKRRAKQFGEYLFQMSQQDPERFPMLVVGHGKMNRNILKTLSDPRQVSNRWWKDGELFKNASILKVVLRDNTIVHVKQLFDPNDVPEGYGPFDSEDPTARRLHPYNVAFEVEDRNEFDSVPHTTSPN